VEHQQLQLALDPLTGRATNRIVSILALVGVAEEAIAHAVEHSPDEAATQRAKGSFLALYPDAEFIGKDPLVFRAHCDELLSRALAGTSLAPGTDAECLLAMSLQSQKHPFNGTGCAAFEMLFVSVMGSTLPGDRAHEAHDGAAAELIAGLRKKLANKDRKWNG
jgi:hypothetical protein